VKKLFALPALLLTLTQLVHAQKFTPGYYVTTSGDTVKANLVVRKKNRHIRGLATHDGKLLKPADLSAAGIGRVNYVVRALSIDKSPKAGNVTDTMLLEVMSREKISLLFSVDEYDKNHFFIEDENGAITELGLRVFDQGDGITFQELPVYKDKLKSLFPACRDLTGEIDKTGYTKNDIHSIFEKLYECKYGAAPKMEITKDVVNDFGIIAGVSSTDVTLKERAGAPSSVAPDLVFDKSNDLTGGFFMESRFAKLGKQFSLRNELTHRKYDETSKDYYQGKGQTSLFGSIAASYVKYTILARLAISQNTMRPFVSAGLSPSLLIGSSNRLLTITNGAPQIQPLLNKVKSFEVGYFFGAGLIYNRFSIEARVERSTGLNPENLKTSVGTLYIMVSFKLWESYY